MFMKDLKIATIQTALHWEDVGANLAHLEERVWQVDPDTDLVVLPEMFNSGFTMNAAAVAEPMNLTTFKWMQQLSSQTGACLTGSYIVKENGEFFNRLLWMRPDGSFETYDKRHLFSMAGEHQVFSPGQKRLVVTLQGWKIGPMLCYDLRFPVWSRNRLADAWDLLLYVANWPEARASAWQILLPARAIENACYVLGVNRIGNDDNNINYNGGSQLCDFKGQCQHNAGEEDLTMHTVLSAQHLLQYRSKFPVMQDADDFTLNV